MISLNLTSPDQKKMIKNIILFQHGKNIAFILLSAAAITSVLFFFINLILQND
jgi:hypothetical protein